jgi:WbqC-like protein family
MNGCVAGCQYIPSIEYFAHWMHHGLLTLEKHEHFQKRTWRNKTAIIGPDHPLLLTVPLQKGKHQQQKIEEVRIAYDDHWPIKHIRSLKTAYGKTPFSEEVISGFEIILQSGFDRLWDLNIACLQYATALIGGEWPVEKTRVFVLKYPPDIVDLRQGVPGGAALHTLELPPVYQQIQRLGKSHLPNLCIFDLLCHLGPETSPFLARYANKLYNHP